MEEIQVHPRVTERHPELFAEDVRSAWTACIRAVPRLDRNPNEYIAIGSDKKGRLIEMIARRVTSNTWLIFHALTPPTRKALQELGMVGK